jgi:chorismate mutase
MAQSEKLDLSKTFIAQYMDAVHMESIAHQKRVLDGMDKNNNQ